MKLVPGDIIELDNADGAIHVQVTHTHAAYPEVVRVLERDSGNQADGPMELASRDTRLVAMVALGAALESGKINGRKVGNVPLTGASRDFPVFRMPVKDKQGNIAYWWFWDGDGLRYETDLSDEASAYPLRMTTSLEEFIRQAKMGR